MAASCIEQEDQDEIGKIIIINYSKGCLTENVLQGILKCSSVDELESSCVEGSVTYFSWKIENKYYSADVLIGYTNECDPTKHDVEVLKTADAFLFCLELCNEQQLKNIESWLPTLNEFEPSIQLLLGTEASSELVPEKTRQALLRWCAEHSFEMIEQYPADTYEDDDYPEKFGYDRVREALQIHTWPNMDMKDNPIDFKAAKPTENGISFGDSDLPSIPKKSEKEVLEEQFGYSELANQLDDVVLDDVEGQSFEELFDKLKEMKDRAMSLPVEDRKDYAEKVVVAFWKALGGDDDEIEGI